MKTKPILGPLTKHIPRNCHYGNVLVLGLFVILIILSGDSH